MHIGHWVRENKRKSQIKDFSNKFSNGRARLWTKGWVEHSPFSKCRKRRSFCCGAVEMNPTRNHEVVGSIPGLASGLRIPRRCRELWCRSQRWLGSRLLWLWCRPVATVLIRPLAWEPPYAVGVALEKTKRPKKKNAEREKACNIRSMIELSKGH